MIFGVEFNGMEAYLNERAPHAWFFSKQAMDEVLPIAIEEAKALADFEEDGCEDTLWQSLLGLGWDSDSISSIVAKPKRRRAVGYAQAPDLRGWLARGN